MLKVYVIGSRRRAALMDRIVKRLEGGPFEVSRVREDPERIPELAAGDRFDEAERADVIIAAKGRRGDYGWETLYLMEHARRAGKKILMTDGRDLDSIYDYLLIY